MSRSTPSASEAIKQLERKFVPRIIFKTGLYGFTIATFLVSIIVASTKLKKDDVHYLETVSYHRSIEIKEFLNKYKDVKPGLIPNKEKVEGFLDKVKEDQKKN
ncbi:hypothetical protein ABK040_016645 [Willaertia magna]